MTSLLYFFISFIACIIGGISGIGGGIIIKPVLDAMGTYNLSTIGVLSSCTVLTMTIVSLWKSRHGNVKISLRITLFFALGGILGGLIGKHSFDVLRIGLSSEAIAGAIQSGLLLLMTLWVLIYVNFKQRFPTYQVTHPLICLIVGFILGGVSSFLGIGGGPINIAFLAIIFGMDSKTAALNSITIIFFSQVANLFTIAVTGGFGQYDLTVLPLMLLGAVGGGLVGSFFSKKMSNQDVDRFFCVVLVIIMLINSYNMVSYLS